MKKLFVSILSIVMVAFLLFPSTLISAADETVTGTVVDENGEPFEGIVVYIYSGTLSSGTLLGFATTDTDGNFSIGSIDMDSENLCLIFTLNNVTMYPIGLIPVGDGYYELTDANMGRIPITRPSNGIETVTGTIVDESGEPLSDVLVSIYSGTPSSGNLLGSATTDTNGNFSIENINMTTNDLRITFRQYGQEIYTVGREYHEDGSYSINDHNMGLITIMPATGYVMGFVYNENNQPLSGVRVVFERDEKSTIVYTNSTGLYMVSQLTTGQYTITVERSDRLSVTLENFEIRKSDEQSPQMINDIILTLNISTYLFGMDLPHSLMAIGLMLGIVFVAISVAYCIRMKKTYDREKEPEP